MLALLSAAAWIPSAPAWNQARGTLLFAMKISAADEQRLLMSEEALNAFIAAEMRQFLTEKMKDLDDEGSLADTMRRNELTAGDDAVNVIVAQTEHAFAKLHSNQDAQDVLSNLGSAISYLR